MGQEDILNVLEKNPKQWFSIDEVKTLVKEEKGFTGNVWRQVNKLCMADSVETRLKKLNNCRWGYKRVIKHKITK